MSELNKVSQFPIQPSSESEFFSIMRYLSLRRSQLRQK